MSSYLLLDVFVFEFLSSFFLLLHVNGKILLTVALIQALKKNKICTVSIHTVSELNILT